MKNYTKLSLALILGASFVFGCKKKDDMGMGEGKTAKFTITVNGIENQDYASFVIVGGDYQQTKSLWKVNGVVQTNEEAISLDKDDFTGGTKTYVIESTKPVTLATVGIQCLNYGADYTVSYKAEIGGKVVKEDQNVVVGVNKDYTHNFNY